MGSKNFRRILLLLGAVSLCLGFRSYPGIKGWRIDSGTTAGRKVFLTMAASGKTLANNLPASDSLSAAGPTLTESQILTSVIDDYNGIQDSNLILAMDTDPDFSTNSQNHRVYIEEASAAGVSSGEAQPTFSGNEITECKIQITPKAYEDAKFFVRLLAHEIGHCVGLEHPQETVWAVMSYFYNDDVLRLAIDDKIGIVHLYPRDSAYGEERPTFGLSCAQQ